MGWWKESSGSVASQPCKALHFITDPSQQKKILYLSSPHFLGRIFLLMFCWHALNFNHRDDFHIISNFFLLHLVHNSSRERWNYKMRCKLNAQLTLHNIFFFKQWLSEKLWCFSKHFAFQPRRVFHTMIYLSCIMLFSWCQCAGWC